MQLPPRAVRVSVTDIRTCKRCAVMRQRCDTDLVSQRVASVGLVPMEKGFAEVTLLQIPERWR